MREVAPGSSAQYAEAAISVPHRAIARIAGIFSIPAILHPFPDVAVHVVETPRIGGERVDTSRCHPPLALHATDSAQARLPILDEMRAKDGLTRRGFRAPGLIARATASADLRQSMIGCKGLPHSTDDVQPTRRRAVKRLPRSTHTVPTLAERPADSHPYWLNDNGTFIDAAPAGGRARAG